MYRLWLYIPLVLSIALMASTLSPTGGRVLHFYIKGHLVRSFLYRFPPCIQNTKRGEVQIYVSIGKFPVSSLLHEFRPLLTSILKQAFHGIGATFTSVELPCISSSEC